MVANMDVIAQNADYDVYEVLVCDSGDIEGYDGVWVHGARRVGNDEFTDVLELPNRVRYALVGYRHENYFLKGFSSFQEFFRLTKEPSIIMWGVVAPGTLKSNGSDNWTFLALIPKRMRA